MRKAKSSKKSLIIGGIVLTFILFGFLSGANSAIIDITPTIPGASPSDPPGTTYDGLVVEYTDPVTGRRAMRTIIGWEDQIHTTS